MGSLTEPSVHLPPSRHLEFVPRPFAAARWLPGSHAQTLAGKLLRSERPLPVERIRIETPDDDFLDLDLAPDPGPESAVVLILHGLEGSSRRAYVRGAMAEITRRGMLAVGMNFRSCSGVPNRQPRFYHSGETGDVAFVLDRLRARFPSRPLAALGFSLGGNMLLRFLGESGGDRPADLAAAVAISVPYDLTEGSRMLESGMMGRLYSGYFLRSLRKKTREKAGLLRDVIDLERALAARSLREFDEAATAPLHGFRDAATYYREASSKPLLPRVRVPTLLMHALDDPFLPPEALPRAEADENPWLLPSFQRRGGHVGFIERGPPHRPSFWVEAEAARYLAWVLEADTESGAPSR